MTVAFLGPCGMNTPHTHPRATEMLYLVNGSITTGMIPENTARFVFNQLQAGQAQVFLKGSIHYQQNELCDPVMFVGTSLSIDYSPRENSSLIISSISCSERRRSWRRVHRSAL